MKKMYVGNVGMYTPASADTLEIYSAIKRNEIVTFAKKKNARNRKRGEAT